MWNMILNMILNMIEADPFIVASFSQFQPRSVGRSLRLRPSASTFRAICQVPGASLIRSCDVFATVTYRDIN